MTKTRKHIIELLLSGHYLIGWKNSRGTDCYRLYDCDGNPVRNVLHRTIKKLDRYIDPEIKIWKKDKRGRITLSPANILKLRKNHTIKVLYKKLKNKAA